MAVNQKKYSKTLEKAMAEGKNFADAHKVAVKAATVKAVTTKKKAEEKADAKVYSNAEKNLKKLREGKLGRLARLKRTAKELIYGEKTYLKKD